MGVMARVRSDDQRRLDASPDSGDARRNPTRFLLLSAALPALLVCPAWAAKWDIVPTLIAEETYTDNVRLAPAGSERGDFVTRLRPGVSIIGSGPRLRLSAAFAAEALYSVRTGNTAINPQLNAGGNAELVQQLLFVDASASISQQNISLLGPQADSNVNDTGNRTTVKSFLVSPYLRHAFGTVAEGEARLRYSTVSSDAASSSLSNSQATGLGLRLASGPSFKLYTWNIAYNTDTIYYTDSQDVTTQRISATGTRLITPQVTVVSTVGYEESDYLTLGPAPKGTFWNAGLDWTPTPRTRVAATTGKRYFGKTYTFDFSHRTRLTVWSANYSEDVTTAREQVLVPTTVDTAGFLDTLFLSRFPDPALRQQAVRDFIARNGLPPSLTVPLNFFTNQIFLDKRWQASVGILGVRNTVFANVFRSTRTPEDISAASPASGDFAATSGVEQTGASVNWNWRLSPRTASNVDVGYTRSDFSGIGREDSLKFIRFTLTHQFQPKLSGSLNYHRLQNDSSQSGAGYTENAVSAALNMRF